jgi:hypothetical protein
MGEDVDLVARSLAAESVEAFEARVADQAERLREDIAAGRLDNHDFAVGLEMEVYAVERPAGPVPGTGPAGGVRGTAETGPGDAGADAIEPRPSTGEADPGPTKARPGPGGAGSHPPRLAPLPPAVFEAGATKELGLHNAEINTEPDVFSGDGLARQARAIESGFDEARAAAREHGLELVLDAMWTVPPREGTATYLGAHDRVDDLVLAENMRPDPRYRAIDNDVRRRTGGEIPFAVPGVDRTFPSILFESLATSIQPHLQIPSTAAFTDYYNAAIRTLGPVLALATNSPFLPADLYEGVDDPASLVEETPHELRIAAFEQSVNHTPSPKVRVPRDIETATAVVDRIVADDLVAPFCREWLEAGPRETFADEIWEFDYRRTTHWRWLRCVVGGDSVAGAGDERSLRIEYRPLPTQPTVRDVVGLQALTAGLLRGLVAADHPLASLPWAAAERSFYSAVEDGLDADLAWVTAAGDRTGDAEVVFDEVFEFARRGLAESGVDAGDADRYLGPIEERVDAGTTPSGWKKARVRAGLDEGMTLGEAIVAMQREYVRRSRDATSFANWL